MTMDTSIPDDVPVKSPSKFLLDNELFNQLREVQKEITHETDVTPTLKRLIRDIMTDTNINLAKEAFIKRYS